MKSENSTEKYQVTEEQSGGRLDLFLTFNSNRMSRTAVKKQIEQGRVKVNGETVRKPNYKLTTGDELEADYTVTEPQFDKIIPQEIRLDIIYEDEDVIVVNKPIGMVVHPATSNWDGTLLNALAHHFKDLDQVGNKIRSGLIHRLDKDTSGLVMIGKNNHALWHFTGLFSERKVKKTYLALVKGDWKADFGLGVVTVDNFIGRNKTNRKKFAAVAPSKGRRALTQFKAIALVDSDEQGKMTLLEVSPETGRTHQIRVHAAGLGHPVMGDKVYGRNNDFPRLMLHAWKLSIQMPAGEMKTFIAPIDELFFKDLPSDVAKKINQLN